MKTFNDIEKLWREGGQRPDMPGVSEIIFRINVNRKKLIRKNLTGIIILCLTFIFIAWILVNYDYKIATTGIGIIIVFIALLLGIFFNYVLLSQAAKMMDLTSDAATYLSKLKDYKKKQQSVQTKGITFYFIILSLGLILYMYEFAVRDLIYGIISYTATLAWIAFVWFYLRKKRIAKNEKEINDQIELIEKVKGDLESNLS